MMHKNIIIAIIAIVVLAGAWWLLAGNREDEAMMEKDGAMMEKDGAAKKDDVMKKDEAMMSEKMTLALAAQSSSGITGTATFAAQGNKTEVSITLTGDAQGAVHPAHIHMGACPTPGAVKYPLTNIVGGKSVTVLDISLDQLWKELPLAINAHQSAADLKTFIACGDLNAATGGDAMMKKDGAMMEKDSAMKKDDAMMMAGGQYVAYAADKLAFAKEGKVVLFFRASWCPTCRALDSDIRANLGDIPKNVLILDVDYDQYKDLKTKYGVTSQHTLVQVDASGNQIAKWSGSPELSDLLKEVK